MPLVAGALEEFQAHCPDANHMEEGGRQFVHLPSWKLPNGQIVEALILLNGTGSYPTRLLLSAKIAGRGQNWEVQSVFGKTWHTWSWKDIAFEESILETLIGHLEVFL